MECRVDDHKVTTGSETTEPAGPRPSSLSPSLKGRELWRSLEDLSQSDEFVDGPQRASGPPPAAAVSGGLPVLLPVRKVVA